MPAVDDPAAAADVGAEMIGEEAAVDYHLAAVGAHLHGGRIAKLAVLDADGLLIGVFDVLVVAEDGAAGAAVETAVADPARPARVVHGVDEGVAADGPDAVDRGAVVLRDGEEFPSPVLSADDIAVVFALRGGRRVEGRHAVRVDREDGVGCGHDVGIRHGVVAGDGVAPVEGRRRDAREDGRVGRRVAEGEHRVRRPRLVAAEAAVEAGAVHHRHVRGGLVPAARRVDGLLAGGGGHGVREGGAGVLPGRARAVARGVGLEVDDLLRHRRRGACRAKRDKRDAEC